LWEAANKICEEHRSLTVLRTALTEPSRAKVAQGIVHFWAYF